MYPCVCTSVAGFIQQLAVSYVSNGYVFYVLGYLLEGKDPRRVDEKLIERYGVEVSKWSRARRKRAGAANIQYLRYGRLFVLLATHGEHEFFRAEGTRVRDIRRVPLKAFGYAVSHRRGRVQVRIEREEFKRLKGHFMELAAHRRASVLSEEFSRLQFEPYAPVRRQLFRVLLAVNHARRLAGFEPVPIDALRVHRRIVRPFGEMRGRGPLVDVHEGEGPVRGTLA